MNPRRWFHAAQGNILAGAAIVLPVVLSVGLLVWLFGTVANFTDTLLVFLPKSWTHRAHGEGPPHWYASVAALGVTLLLLGLIGHLARYYFGRQIITLADTLLLRVPLLNKIYGTIKQVNDAFTAGDKTAFKQVVLVEFPRAGAWSVGFLTAEENASLAAATGRRLVPVFIPTTPIPTNGFLIFVPPDAITPLDITVAEGIKHIVSLGALAPGDATPAPGRG
jgi:uncharacterized membrane protein